MTFTFKLSRRLARLRALALLAITSVAGCSGTDLNSPESPPSNSDPIGVLVSPDSSAVAAGGSVQFDAIGADAALRWQGGNPRSRVASVTLSPALPVLVPGGVQPFEATATTKFGSTVRVTFRWSATGGTVDSTGRYTAGAIPGRYQVIATADNAVSDTATVTVTAATSSELSEVLLGPASVALPAGGRQDFTLVGKAGDGSAVPVTPRFNATGGSVSSTGRYTAPQAAGSYRVMATDSITGMADTSNVTVAAPEATLSAVVLTPENVSLQSGGTAQLSASGRMSDGSTVPISATYTATGGTVSATGKYTAGSTAGSYRVVATIGGYSDTASVTITALEPPPPPPPPPPSPSVGMLFDDGMTGLANWYSREACCTHSQTIVSSTAREGSTAVRFELRRDDPSGHNLANHINQLVRPKLTGWSGSINGPFQHGQEVWFGFSVYIPTDWVNDAESQREILFEVHDTPDNDPSTGQPDWGVPKTAFFYLLAEGGNFVWVNRWDDCAYGTSCWKPYGVERRPYAGPLKKGGWTDFVVHAKWDYRQNGPGLLEIWRDGQKVTTQTGPNAYNQQNPGFFKLGPYKWSWSNTAITKRVVHYDAVRIGGSSSNYASVAPR